MMLALVVALLLFSSCTPRGFDRVELTRATRVVQEVVTDAEIARVLALQPQLTFPFRSPSGSVRRGRTACPASVHLDEDREVVLGALARWSATGSSRDGHHHRLRRRR
jgi:hypothetical protein